jgi:UDP-glucose 4-epimerase
MTENILVTGGAGYVGSHTCKELAAAGYRPIVLDNLSQGHSWAVKWGALVIGDIADPILVPEIIETFSVRAVLHFAAHAYVGESLQQPHKYFDNNFSKTLALLNSIRTSGLDKFVFSSSCATYGVPRVLPIPEDHPQQPISPYGESKLFVERVLRRYEQAYDLRSVTLRYFNAAGADPGGALGELHSPETHLLPIVLQCALGQRDAVRIFGTDYPTPDGTCVRDYVHVCDLAAAHQLALERLLDAGLGGTYNLGNSRGYSVMQVIEHARRITQQPVRTLATGRRAGDPAVLVADSALARRELGWRPAFENLDDMLATAWRWHAKHSGRARVAAAG